MRTVNPADTSPSEAPASASTAAPDPASAAPVSPPAVSSSAESVPSGRAPAWVWGGLALTALSVTSLALVWTTQQRVRTLESELVRRQQTSQDQATEARLLAKQAHDASAEVAAKLALLDARVAESALQRTQVEELISSLSRSRDENVLADVEASLRVAQQQATITGSAEPLMAALRQSEERLARYNQPRLERVRRAVARDLDRVRAVALVDLPSLSIRLDEAVRVVDELPLLASAERKCGAGSTVTVAAAPVPAVPDAPWWELLRDHWRELLSRSWGEIRSLVRVTRIDQPDAVLMAPEQQFFVRENLKLRLLNARLSLLSRQFDQAQSDLAQAQQMIDRYFDRGSRRVLAASELVKQVGGQSRQVTLPRPDETLAALAAAAAGR